MRRVSCSFPSALKSLFLRNGAEQLVNRHRGSLTFILNQKPFSAKNANTVFLSENFLSKYRTVHVR